MLIYKSSHFDLKIVYTNSGYLFSLFLYVIFLIMTPIKNIDDYQQDVYFLDNN